MSLQVAEKKQRPAAHETDQNENIHDKTTRRLLLDTATGAAAAVNNAVD